MSSNSKDLPIYEEAAKIIQGERREDYGSVKESFENVAMVWTGIIRARTRTNILLDGPTVAILMAAFKLVREGNREKRDNRVDAIGYILLEDQIINMTPKDQNGPPQR